MVYNGIIEAKNVYGGITMTLGDKLSRLRKENNYTQEQLADILGVSRQAISKWESDAAYPETDKLIRLSALYRCSLDYLVKDDADVQEVAVQVRQGSETSSKADNLFKGILRFAPTVLYSLWALLLWAFYAASFLKYTDDSLYQWFGKTGIYMMQPEINALISLGVISGAYIVVLGMLQRFGSRKANLIANLCSFVFQAAVFVAVMCQIGVAKSVDLKCGKVVVITASLTGVFVLLQAVFLALDRYFNHEERVDLTPRKTIEAFRKFGKCLSMHKVLAIVVACVLLAGCALSIVLPLTVGNVFNTNRVARIELGDSRDDVVKVLGKPVDFDLEKFSKYFDSDELQAFSKQNVYIYCSPKAERLIKEMLRVIDKLEECAQSNASDVSVIYARLGKLINDFVKIEFKYIEVYFEKGAVVEVEYDSKYSVERENDVKWNVGDNKKQRISLIPNEIPFGQNPYSTELYAQVFYADGSYRMSKIESLSRVVGNSTSGWAIDWSDHWGSYRHAVFESVDNSNVVERGEWSDNVNYVVTKDANGGQGYTLTIISDGAQVDASKVKFDFNAYRNKVVEVVVADTITKLPSGIFADFVNLTSAKLSKNLTSISSSMFQGCSKLTTVNIPSSVTAIENYAFYGCSSLKDVTLPDAITTVGKGAFQGCASITEITFPTENLISIGAHAFDGCGLQRLSVDGGVYAVGDGAFANCTSLTSVYWESYIYPNDLGEGIFANTPKLTTVEMGTDYIPDRLFKNCSSITTLKSEHYTYVGEEAFRNCTSLATIDIARLQVGEYAFAGCTSLTSAVAEFVREGAFEGCVNLKSVELTWTSSINYATVGDRAFYGCTSLTSVTLSSGTNEIGVHAFYGCTSLKQIDLTHIRYINEYAFYGCTNLVYAKLGWTKWRLEVFNNNSWEEIYIDFYTASDAAIKLRSSYSNYKWYSVS